MEKEKLEGMIIDYIDGKLDTPEKEQLEQLLAADRNAYQLYTQFRELMSAMDKSAQLEPSGAAKMQFEQYLNEEVKKENKTKTIFFAPTIYRAAAAVLLLLAGAAIGYWINKTQQRDAEILALKEQMTQMKAEMMTRLDNQQSASQRIIAVSEVIEYGKPDDEIVNALVKTLNEDANTNVRMAALDALSRFSTEPHVRTALIKSMAKQTDPVVQIALIQLMVKMKEKGIVNDLKKIVEDDGSIKAVKDEAYSGLLKLS